MPHQPETDPGKAMDVPSRNGSRPYCHINLHAMDARYRARNDTHNLRFCLTTNVDERIQQIEIDQETLQPIAQEVEAKMLAFADKLDL